MSYLDRLKARIAETGLGDTPTKPTELGFVSFVGTPTRPIYETQARAIRRQWPAGLATLDYTKPPSGMSTMRWGQLLDDAEFIFNGFGDQLAREGWSPLDVYGVLPWCEGGGVLLDRLQGARSLKLDGEGRAFWSHYGVTFRTSRDVGEHLLSSGLLLIWDRRMSHAGVNP